jgi:predicted Zn-dependent protease
MAQFLSVLGLLSGLVLLLVQLAGSGQAFSDRWDLPSGIPIAATPVALSANLPAAQVHPLPPTLANWQNKSGDYFDQVQLTDVNYLVWSQFPIKVYVEPASAKASTDRSALWVKSVLQAIQEWTVYLPLQVVDQPDQADIMIRRSPIPLQVKPGERLTQLRRARSAETRFELYPIPQAQGAVLAHRVTVIVRPNQANDYILAAARHELGHALGIWGHSPRETDTMYFSQVRHPPLISPRDVNTLKRVYEQPTRLGWPIAAPPSKDRGLNKPGD